MSLVFSYAGASHVGLVRGNNEDSAYAGQYLLALADGMGGHAAGEIASQIVINSLSSLNTPDLQEPLEQLEAAMTAGNITIAEEIEANPETDGMGCTLDAVVLADGALHLCHVGDSRAYRMRDGELTQITRDDTFVQSLVDEGRLDAADASSHPQRSLILKALTGHPVEPTLQTFDVQPGDRYLLCSDGLSDPVSSDTIRDVLKRSPLDEIPERLIDLALRSGGPDNVTVVVGEVSSTNDGDAQAQATEPIIVGALDPTVTDQPRPDTAAGRAMNMVVTQQPLPQAAPSETVDGDDIPSLGDDSKSEKGSVGKESLTDDAQATARDSAADRDNADDAIAKKRGDTPKSRSRKPLIITLIILVIAAIAIPWTLRNYLHNTYFIAANEQDEIVLYHGTATEPLGITLHWPYHRTCLSEKAEISVYNADDPQPSGCHVFTLDDLQPAARARVKSLPEGSYDDVQRQLHRLASAALPLCVTRTSEEPKPDNAAAQPSDAEGATTTTPPSEALDAEAALPATDTEPSDTTSTSTATDPGDLTTAGVNCREVN